MTSDQIKSMTTAFESILQSAMYLERLALDAVMSEAAPSQLDAELLEAITEDVDRAYRAMKRILHRENALPHWAKEE